MTAIVAKTDGDRPLQTRHNTATSSASDLLVGLGWDPLETDSGAPFDGDLMWFLLNAEGKVIPNGVVYYKRPVSQDGSCYIGTDNRDGEGPGEDEVGGVCRELIPSSVHKVVGVASIYQAQKRDQHFGLPERGFVTVTDRTTNRQGDVTHEPLSKFAHRDAIVACELTRDRSAIGGWAQNTNMRGADFATLMNEFGVEIKY